jgi:hypothetical protein
VISGKGMYLWNISRSEGGEAEAIARVAVEAGLSHVLVKIADGTQTFPYPTATSAPEQAQAVIDALRRSGIQAWGWQYVYGNQPEREADIAIQRCTELGVDGFIVNAEVEYKHRPSQAERYMRRLRGGLGEMLIGLSSYRFPNLHREFPFNAFLEGCDVNMPQVYWMRATNAGEQLMTCIAQFRQSWLIQKPILPTGSAFQEHGWRPRPTQIFEFLDTARKTCGGANFWVWENARRHAELWAAIRDYPWGDTAVEAPVAAAIRLRVIPPTLNVRSGPAMSRALSGSLSGGTFVTVEAVHVENARRVWIRHSAGWSAMVYDGSVLMQEA